MAQDTPDRRMAALATLAEEFGLADVYVFGSRAADFVQDAEPVPTSHRRANPISTSVSARFEGSS